MPTAVRAQLRAVLLGVGIGLAVGLHHLIVERVPRFGSLGVWMIILVLAGIGLVLWDGKGRYLGIGDLFLHVHKPPGSDSVRRWSLQAILSACLSWVTGVTGPEGWAIEGGQAVAMRRRSPGARWYDHQRRTDAACVLSAALSATFHAPWVGIVAPVEYRLGGQALAPILSAFVSDFVCRWWLEHFDLLGSGRFWGLSRMISSPQIEDLRLWLVAVTVGLVVGVFASGILLVIRRGREVFLETLAFRGWFGIAASVLGLLLLAFAFEPHHFRAEKAYEWLQLTVNSVQRSPDAAAQLWLTSFWTLLLGTLWLSVFGTSGVFSWIVGVGALLGYGMGSLFPAAWHTSAEMTMMFTIVGLWGGVLGLPLTGGILASSLTDQWALAVPCAMAGLAAVWVRGRMGFRSLPEVDAETRGLILDQGRARGVLDGLTVGEAMVTDAPVARENDSMTTLRGMLERSQYPFVTILNTRDELLGILTADSVDRAFRQRRVEVLEAKDLLFLNPNPLPTLSIDATLALAGTQFGDSPLLPVVDEGGKFVGLLFAHSVRIAYDQEVAKRALSPQV